MIQGETGRTIQGFLDDLAAGTPTPGGGAAAALAGAMGAALVSMVANLTLGRPKFAEVEPTMRQVVIESERIRGRLTELADEDARAYAQVAAAYRQPRASAGERAARVAAIQQALAGAIQPPLEAMELCRSLFALCLQVAAHGNPNVVSDAGVAAELAAAGTRGSILNIQVNLAELTDEDLIARSQARVDATETGLDEDLNRVIGIVRAKLAPKAKR